MKRVMILLTMYEWKAHKNGYKRLGWKAIAFVGDKIQLVRN